jgi:hypothetical protein
VFGALVVENRPAEMTILVDVLFEGYVSRYGLDTENSTDICHSECVEVEWKYICVLDPDLSQRPQPSPNAVPMPEGMNKKLVSASNRQDGVPNQDEIFTQSPNSCTTTSQPSRRKQNASSPTKWEARSMCHAATSWTALLHPNLLTPTLHPDLLWLRHRLCLRAPSPHTAP